MKGRRRMAQWGIYGFRGSHHVERPANGRIARALRAFSDGVVYCQRDYFDLAGDDSPDFRPASCLPEQPAQSSEQAAGTSSARRRLGRGLRGRFRGHGSQVEVLPGAQAHP